VRDERSLCGPVLTARQIGLLLVVRQTYLALYG
jgi:hypothetical protein